MLKYVTGDIFNSNASTIVNTVNCRGVMGKGLALQFKLRYPAMYTDYVHRCRIGAVRIGEPYLFRVGYIGILNFPTKDHWRFPSRVDYVDQGLRYFVEHYAEMGITSVAFPQLGCQNGGLDWKQDVRPLMELYLGPLGIEIEVYVQPSDIPDHEPTNVCQHPASEGLVGRINAATSVEDLIRLLTVSAQTAQEILKYRDDRGSLSRLDELLRVKHIGPATYKRIAAKAEKVIVSPPDTAMPEQAKLF